MTELSGVLSAQVVWDIPSLPSCFWRESTGVPLSLLGGDYQGSEESWVGMQLEVQISLGPYKCHSISNSQLHET